MMKFFKYILKPGFNIVFVVLVLLNAVNLSGQAYVKFALQESPQKMMAGERGLVGVDVYAFGDYDGRGVVNSANLIIDGDILKRSSYSIYKWESLVSAPGNGITYSPKPFQNPIINFASLEGVENGGHIGTLWLIKEERKGANQQLDLKVRNNDLFFYSKVDGVELSYEDKIQTFVKETIDVVVYPNPFIDEVYFMLRSNQGTLDNTLSPVSVLVLDNAGKVHFRFEDVDPEFNVHQRLSLPDIAAGTYFLAIVQADKVLIQSEPIIKVK